MNDKVTVELSRKELNHLQNDVIHNIYDIKKSVFGDSWSFGCELSKEELELLNDDMQRKLFSYGYYSRLELKRKLDAIENKSFDVPDSPTANLPTPVKAAKPKKKRFFTIFMLAMSILIMPYGMITTLIEDDLFQFGASLIQYLSGSFLCVLIGALGWEEDNKKGD